MDRNKFNSLLKQANLTKKQLAEIIGMQYSSVNNWGSSQEFPKWVESWLQNYIKAQTYEEVKDKLYEVFKFEKEQ